MKNPLLRSAFMRLLSRRKAEDPALLFHRSELRGLMLPLLLEQMLIVLMSLSCATATAWRIASLRPLGSSLAWWAAIDATIASGAGGLMIAAAILRAAPLPPGRLNFAMKGGRKVFARAWRRGYTAEAGRWPLTPPFEALGACILLGNMTEAIAGSRGWATEDDLAPLRVYLRDRMRASGIA